MKRILLALFCGIAYLISGCSDIEYNHPLDSKGSNLVSDEKLKDDNGDEVANLWDPTHPLFQANRDTTPPILTLHGQNPLRVPVNDPQHLIAAYSDSFTVSDDRDNTLTKEKVIRINQISTLLEGKDSIIYIATDQNNNKTTKSRIVIIYDIKIDTTRPDIFFQDEIIVNRGDPFDPMNGVTAFDNVDGAITSKIKVTGTVNTAVAGTYTLSYSVTDAAGNTMTKPRKVIVQENQGTDTNWPIITLTGSKEMVIQAGQPYVEPGYSAYDTTDGDLTAAVVVSVTPQPFERASPAINEYTISYSVTDKSNHRFSETRKLTVRSGGGGNDDLAPIITLVNKRDSVTTIPVGTVWKKPAVTVTDNVDNLSADSVKVQNPPNTAVPMTYTVTLTIKDKSGNTGYLTIKVIVADIPRDVTPPVITIIGKNPDTIGTGSAYLDKATARDSVDGDITVKITKTPATLNTATARKDSIVYEVADRAGNKATAVRIVVIIEGLVQPLLEKYGVPSASPLPLLDNATFKSKEIDGTGAPDLSIVKEHTISWAPTQSTVHVFSVRLSAQPWYADYKNFGGIEQTFGQAKSTFTLSKSPNELKALDGEYYIKYDGTNLVWVKTDGSFAIIWKP